MLTEKELRKLLQTIDDPLTRAAAAMMAFTGFDHWSLNRITFRDGLPELRITGKGARTKNQVLRIPMVVATPMLQWAPGSPLYRQGPYGKGWRWSFLSKEGCDYLLAYLRTRLHAKGRGSLAPSHRLFFPSEPFFYGYFRGNVVKAAKSVGLGRWSERGCEMRLRRYFTERMKSVGACKHCIEFMSGTEANGPLVPICEHSVEDMRETYTVAASFALTTRRKPKPNVSPLAHTSA